MGSSISCALEFLKTNKLNYKAVLITLADQPLIDMDYYNFLILHFAMSKERIIASDTNNKPTVPIILIIASSAPKIILGQRLIEGFKIIK